MVATFNRIERFIDSRRVNCYTVTFDSYDSSEFDNFLYRMSLLQGEERECVYEVLQLLQNVVFKFGLRQVTEGRQYGNDDINLQEISAADKCEWLSIEANSEYTRAGVSLFCIALAPNNLIVLNGCQKTSPSRDDCPKCKQHIHIAQLLVEGLKIDLLAEKIITGPDGITIPDGYQLFIKESIPAK